MLHQAVISLLFDHDCVIIPGFGGLIGAYKSAGLEPASHQLSPPSKQLTFNRHLTHNDGLLATEISLRHAVPYSRAMQMVEQEVQSLKALLLADHRFDLTDVGLFYVEKDQTLQFRPYDRVNFLKESFGLERITLLPVAAGETPIVPLLTDGPASRDRIHWRKIAAVAAFPIALTLGFWQLGTHTEVMSSLSMAHPFSIVKSDYSPSETKAAVNADFDSDDFAEFLKQNEGAEKADFAFDDENTTTIRLMSSGPPADTVTKGAFCLIAGAFKVEENAERMLKTLQNEGHPALLAGMKGELHLVAISSHSTKAEAENAISAADKKGLWIFRK